jgi:NAD(P)H-flavin reductase/hemoglobin-like flavoprotein
VSMDTSPLRASVALVEQRRSEAVRYFYAHLYAGHPELRAVFPITAVEEHDRLFNALLYIVKNVHALPLLATELQQVGRDHRKFGLSAEHYEVVGASFLAAGAAVLADAWTSEVAAGWQSAYGMAARVMIDAASAASDEDRWCVAEVVVHDKRTWDIAVLELRPTAPYAFRAGQYTTVETPHWPRLWRPYSIANAPRPDGSLDLHVRQIPGGEASWALVDAAKPGQFVKIGPAAGGLVLDHTNPTDLLLVAGGTGLAPLKALVEDVAANGGNRRVCLFAGARTEEDLYDLAALTQLDRRYPWLAVIPAVSDEPSYRGHRGLVADVVGEYGPWSGFDAYVCGPPAMVAATTARLHELGIAPQSIHHEAWQADIAPDAVPVLGSDVIRRPRHQPMSYASASSGYRASEMQKHEIYSDEVLEGTVYAAAERASAPTPASVRVIQAVPAAQEAPPSPAAVDEQPAVSAPIEPATAPQTASDEARVREMREMIELRRARRSLYAGRRR